MILFLLCWIIQDRFFRVLTTNILETMIKNNFKNEPPILNLFSVSDKKIEGLYRRAHKQHRRPFTVAGSKSLWVLM